MNTSIQSIAQKTLEEAKIIFGVSDVSVEVLEDPEQVIPETGAGGFAHNSHLISVYYDLQNENFKNNFEKEIRSTIMHEFHHVVRNRKYDWKKDTLLGAMITEGLADHFDIEVNGGNPKPWSVALSESELSRVLKLAVNEFNSRDFSYEEWFFGLSEKNIPKWAGYSIGFDLVKKYILKSGKKASELVFEPAETFWDK